MEFGHWVRRSSLTHKTFRGMLAVTVVLATAFSPPRVVADGSRDCTIRSCSGAQQPLRPTPKTEEAGLSPTAIRNLAIVIGKVVRRRSSSATQAVRRRCSTTAGSSLLRPGAPAAAAVVALGEQTRPRP